MKREQIIKRVKEVAKQMIPEAVEVYTSGEMFPKCYLATIGECDLPKERITPNFRPAELLAYVQGMAQVFNAIK